MLVKMNDPPCFQDEKTHHFHQRPRDLIKKMADARQEPMSYGPWSGTCSALLYCSPCLLRRLGDGLWGPRTGWHCPLIILEQWFLPETVHVPNPSPRETEMTNGHRCADHSLLVRVGTAWAGGQPPASPDKVIRIQICRCPEHWGLQNEIQRLLIHVLCVLGLFWPESYYGKGRKILNYESSPSHTHTSNTNRDHLILSTCSLSFGFQLAVCFLTFKCREKTSV